MKIEIPIFVRKIRKETRYATILLIVYLLVNLPSLFAQNRFWDEWLIVPDFSGNFEVSQKLFSSMNPLGILYASYNYVLSGFSLFGARILDFFTVFLVAYMYFKILYRSGLLGLEQACLIALIYITLPYNLGKFNLILFAYHVSVLLFLAGLHDYLSRGKLNLLSVIGLSMSFMLQSILVIYYVGALLILMSARKRKEPIKKLHFVIYLSLPIVFIIYKKFFFRPFGLGESYNVVEVGLRQTLTIITSLFTALKQNVAGLLAITVKTISGAAFLWLLAPAVVFMLKGWQISFIRGMRQNIAVLTIGVLFLIASIFPYVAVGKFPIFDDYESRHQILIPFAMALNVYALIGFIRHASVQKHILIICLMAFGYVTNISLYTLIWDGEKVDFVSRKIVENMAFSNHDTFQVTDKCHALAFMNRHYSYSELTGKVSMLTGKQDKFVADVVGFEGSKSWALRMRSDAFRQLYGSKFSSFYYAEDYVQKAPECYVQVSCPHNPSGHSHLASFLPYFAHPRYFASLNVKISCLQKKTD